MEFVIIGAVALWAYTLYRGRLFVRACMYLTYVIGGMSPEKANAKVMQVGYFDAAKLAPGAKQFAAEVTNGKQLPVIAAARAKGFKG